MTRNAIEITTRTRTCKKGGNQPNDRNNTWSIITPPFESVYSKLSHHLNQADEQNHREAERREQLTRERKTVPELMKEVEELRKPREHLRYVIENIHCHTLSGS